MKKTRILAIGTAVPEFSIDQADAACLAQALGITNRWREALPALYQRSGVQRRGSVLLLSNDTEIENRQVFYRPATSTAPLGPTTSERMKSYTQHAGPLLEKACVNVLRQASVSAANVTHLVTVSCTGFVSPGVDHWLIERLKLRRQIPRTHVGFMGCHGLLNALRTAQAIAEAEPKAMVLVGSVELSTLHQQYTEDAQQLVANSLFADGAATALIAGSEVPSVSDRSWMIASSLSWMFPESQPSMSWHIGDHGFQMQLSPEVPDQIASQLRQPVESWLASMEIPLTAIDSWAIHPGGPRILTAVERALNLSPQCLEASRQILREHGNMSSATVAFVLQRLQELNPSNGKALMMAFGPGLHAEMLYLTR
jgi:alkylresorcinol/alkylpyrone synthase